MHRSPTMVGAKGEAEAAKSGGLRYKFLPCVYELLNVAFACMVVSDSVYGVLHKAGYAVVARRSIHTRDVYTIAMDLCKGKP